jgi:hypothetical protein
MFSSPKKFQKKKNFNFIIFIIFVLINEQISPSKDGLRAQAVYDLAEIIIMTHPQVFSFFFNISFGNNFFPRIFPCFLAK